MSFTINHEGCFVQSKLVLVVVIIAEVMRGKKVFLWPILHSLTQALIIYITATHTTTVTQFLSLKVYLEYLY